MKQYHIVDLFAGVGGLSYGFSQLPGFRILAANEIEKDIAAAYSLNHPGVKMLNCDIADLTKERLAGALGGQQVDIVVGGPPCQSYSTLGKRRMDDRANLFLQYKRILQILQPQAFIFENVTGILSMDHGRLFQRVESEFRALGYDVRHDILNAVDFGVPQQRERVILVGMKGDNNYIFPVPTHGPGKKPYVTLKDAIGDLPQLKSGGECQPLRRGRGERISAVCTGRCRAAGNGTRCPQKRRAPHPHYADFAGWSIQG